jgi:hypothetical protein
LKSRRRHALCCGFFSATACLATATGSAAERAVRVTVQARAHFEELSHVSDPDGTSWLRARLLDDSGKPLPAASVHVGAFESSETLQLSTCDPSRGRRRSPRDPFTTDADGRLCVHLARSTAQGSVQLEFRGDVLHLPAQAQVPLHTSLTTLQLAFEAPSIELSLDQPTHRLRLSVAGANQIEPFPAITVVLEEAGRALPLEATEWSRSADALSFSVRSDQLGTPGPARLVARHVGSALAVPAQAEIVALRVASVALSAEAVARSSSGAELSVRAQTSAGPPTSGWIEATEAGELVGTSALSEGSAQLQVATRSTPTVTLSLRYRADDPWWLPSEPIELTLAAPASEEPTRWPWLLLLTPIGYVCLRALQRPAQRQATPSRRRKAAPVLGLRPGNAVAATGWNGRVTDAHDGLPVAGARVEALLPTLRATTSGPVAITDASGHFDLPAVLHTLPEGARLYVSAPLHTEVERPLPPQGRVDIVLMSRRRMLLRRLVRWARSLGPPWARSPAGEPTPADIAGVALRRGDLKTARWAESVQAAAFSDVEVDHTLEASLRAQEPSWQHSGQQREERDDD